MHQNTVFSFTFFSVYFSSIFLRIRKNRRILDFYINIDLLQDRKGFLLFTLKKELYVHIKKLFDLIELKVLSRDMEGCIKVVSIERSL